MSIWNIKESLNNAFQGLQESTNPKMNTLNDILYGVHSNPFDTSITFFTLIGIAILLYGTIIGIVHILSNLNKYSNKVTMKKTFLVLLFVIAGTSILIQKPGTDDYVSLDYSLIYIKNPDDISVGKNKDRPETGYAGEKVRSIYSTPFGDGEEYLVTSLKAILGITDLNDAEKLNTTYKSEDYPEYKKFLLGMNGMEAPYKNLGITKAYISNLDLYDTNVEKTDNLCSEFYSTFKESGSCNNEKFANFIFAIKDNTEDKKRLSKIIELDKDKEFNYENPIKWESDNYKYISGYKATPQRTDIILETKNKEGQSKYLLLPYYDLMAILSSGAYHSNALSFLSSEKVKEADKDNIPKNVKLMYKHGAREIFKFFPFLRDYIDSEQDFYNADKYNPTDVSGFEKTNLERLQYILDYNIANGVTGIKKYSPELLVKDTYNKIKQIEKDLSTIQSNLAVYKKASLKYKNSKSDKVKQTLSKMLSEIDKLQEKVNNEYKELWSKRIKNKTENVTRIYALNLQDIAVTPASFNAFGNGDRYEQNKKQRSHITLIKNVLSDGSNILNKNDLITLKYLGSIEKLDKMTPILNIVNKNNIIAYTFFNAAKYYNKFKLIGGSDELMLQYICDEDKPGEFTEEFLELKATLNIDDDVNNVFDCSANNGKGTILDNVEFKKLGQKIISLYKAKDLTQDVTLIPYFAKIRDADTDFFNNIVTPFKDEDGADGNIMEDAFVSKKMSFGKYKFISPFVYYKYLMNDKIDKIPGFFINLKDISGKVHVMDGTYDLKLGSKKSWYAELDTINGRKYTKTFGFIPIAADVVMLGLGIFNQILLLGIFIFLLSTYLIILKKD